MKLRNLVRRFGIPRLRYDCLRSVQTCREPNEFTGGQALLKLRMSELYPWLPMSEGQEVRRKQELQPIDRHREHDLGEYFSGGFSEPDMYFGQISPLFDDFTGTVQNGVVRVLIGIEPTVDDGC